MNPWGALIAALGLVLLFVAIRNSYGNLAALVPGAGGALPSAPSAPTTPTPAPKGKSSSPWSWLSPILSNPLATP